MCRVAQKVLSPYKRSPIQPRMPIVIQVLSANSLQQRKARGAASFVLGHQLINTVRTHSALKRKLVD
jgi:hypothetical protein